MDYLFCKILGIKSRLMYFRPPISCKLPWAGESCLHAYWSFAFPILCSQCIVMAAKLAEMISLDPKSRTEFFEFFILNLWRSKCRPSYSMHYVCLIEPILLVWRFNFFRFGESEFSRIAIIDSCISHTRFDRKRQRKDSSLLIHDSSVKPDL